MGVDNYLRTYPPKTNTAKAFVYHLALQMKNEQIKAMQEKTNAMHDQIDELKDGIITDRE